MDASSSSRLTRWWLAALACLGLGLLGALWPLATRAYVFEGPRWPNNSTVVLHLVLGSPGKTLLDGSTSWDDVAVAALNVWNPYLGSGVQLSGPIGSAASPTGVFDGAVSFSDSVSGQDFGDDALAVTEIYTVGNLMDETDVMVSSSVTFDSYRGPLQKKKIDLRRVLIHEFGHVLGLDHVDAGTVSIMTPSISDLDTIQADDIAGVQALYPNPPAPTPTPTPTSPPALTSSLAVSGYVNTVLRYQISASSPPWTCTVSGLPPGLSFQPNGNYVSGAPTAIGAYSASVVLTNAAGTSTTTLQFGITDPVPDYFANEQYIGSGVYYLTFPYSAPFGYYSYLADNHYMYHFDLGWEYVFDSRDSDEGIYLYDFASSTFFYTSVELKFPYLYDFSLDAVLYYYPDAANPGRYTSNPRYFYNFSTGQIITK